MRQNRLNESDRRRGEITDMASDVVDALGLVGQRDTLDPAARRSHSENLIANYERECSYQVNLSNRS